MRHFHRPALCMREVPHVAACSETACAAATTLSATAGRACRHSRHSASSACMCPVGETTTRPDKHPRLGVWLDCVGCRSGTGTRDCVPLTAPALVFASVHLATAPPRAVVFSAVRHAPVLLQADLFASGHTVITRSVTTRKHGSACSRDMTLGPLLLAAPRTKPLRAQEQMTVLAPDAAALALRSGRCASSAGCAKASHRAWGHAQREADYLAARRHGAARAHTHRAICTCKTMTHGVALLCDTVRFLATMPRRSALDYLWADIRRDLHAVPTDRCKDLAAHLDAEGMN